MGSEDPEELLQDATLIAVRLLARARVNGKTVTPGNIAYYTLLHLRSGRRSHSASRSDVMGSRTQLVGHSRLDYLDDAVGAPDADEPLTLGDGAHVHGGRCPAPDSATAAVARKPVRPA
ncbi:MAG: hypothetical protein EBS84_16275 [Proteobacteria bacterium]|nr:hypothetical protein [Pseudomonadota bacterium]